MDRGGEGREGCMINPQGFPDPWDGMGVVSVLHWGQSIARQSGASD